MRCLDCSYWWKEPGENHEYCHWVAMCPGDLAPCDTDDNEDEDED